MSSAKIWEQELGHSRDDYPSLAEWISRDPDDETFTFRKFDRLAARNLRFLQCQLVHLEAQLAKCDAIARLSDDVELKRSLSRWENFAKNAQDPGRKEHKRMQLQKEIQMKLREYHEALLLQSEIVTLNKPASRALMAVSNWFAGRNRSGMTSIVSGRAQNVFDNKQDLVALRAPVDKDPISVFLQNHRWVQRSKVVNSIAVYEERHVSMTVAVISTILAAILLVGAIVTLYYLSTDAGRLGALAGFTALFASSVALLTNAKRVEIFAATAAYAAVLVVFVGSDLGNGSSGPRQIDNG